MKGLQQYEGEWDESGDNKKGDCLKVGICSAVIGQQLMLSYFLEVQREFCQLQVSKLEENELQKQLDKIRKKMHFFQQKINRKIDKYFSQLRPQPILKIQTAETLIQSLKNQLELRNRLIQFQQAQIAQIVEREQYLDSKQRIQFAIPLEISETKKRIQEAERFIHIAEIKQKKKSEDLVKVDKNNIHQFERTTLLRTSLEVALLYQINLNQREAKIDDHIYDFYKKINDLDKKLQQLVQIVQQRQIPVSSNKNLLALKQKKALLSKCRDDVNKKIMLTKSGLNKNAANLNTDIQKMTHQKQEKQQRFDILMLQCQQLENKNNLYLKADKDLCKKLRKNISFSYAQTLLKMKKSNSAVVQRQNQPKIEISKSLFVQKPNFKIRKNTSENHSKLEKYASVIKDTNNIDQIILPTTHNLSNKIAQSAQFSNLQLSSRKHRRMSIMRYQSRKQSQAEDIINQY